MSSSSITKKAEHNEAFRKSISDGLNTVLNNDDFAKAVAAHLAKQLQPIVNPTLDISSIEERLDGIATDLKTLKENGPAAVGMALSSHAAKLDLLAADVKTLKDEGPVPVRTALSSQAAKFDLLAMELKEIKAIIGNNAGP
ncbi:hypothetical protein F5884DRAFT_771877 [Xylogone sp. PMI_703]|nr:hypothetical protein F5884DRAFT_771877 [Xylogone sp. PMI_703]